jgi:hypothetical protein
MAVLLPEASGHGGLVNTPLAQLYLYDKIMDKVYESDYLGEITNSEIAERITSCTQEVQIIKAPDIGEWNSYTIGQEMEHSSITFTATKLSICWAAYLAFQFDEMTIHYTCDFDKYADKLVEEGYEKFVAMQRRFVLSAMIDGAHPRNRGNQAGPNGEYELGAPGAPFQVTPQNLPLLFGRLQGVLAAQKRWVPGKMFLLIPIQLRLVMLMSDYANAAWVGAGVSTAVDGAWERPINGFNIIETISLPTVVDSGEQCYYILAGHKEAYAYAADIIGERIQRGENTWTVKYQLLAAWGGAMLYPESLAVAYVYFTV